jgi:transglutaminase-like putative cysteine protease
MQYRIRHTTKYNYVEPVSQCINMAFMLPRNTPRQTSLQASLFVDPLPMSASERIDYFGNRAYHFSIEHPHTMLEVTADSLVDVRQDDFMPVLDFGASCQEALEILQNSKEPELLLAKEYLLNSPLIAATEDLKSYAQPCFDPRRPLVSAVRELTQRIFEDFQYDPDFSDVSTPLQDVLEHRRGVCQDFAHLAIGCIRAMGYPARYISGYLETLPPPGQEKLVGSDASHAWFALYSPGEGWFEFDPTNDKVAGEQHIITAWGRDYADVAPLRGVIFGGGETHSLEVAVDVNRV